MQPDAWRQLAAMVFKTKTKVMSIVAACVTGVRLRSAAEFQPIAAVDSAPPDSAPRPVSMASTTALKVMSIVAQVVQIDVPMAQVALEHSIVNQVCAPMAYAARPLVTMVS